MYILNKLGEFDVNIVFTEIANRNLTVILSMM